MTPKKFITAALRICRTHGAAPIEGDQLGGVLLDTRFGPLRVTPFDNWIALQFLGDPGPPYKAFGLDVNKFSGKWNIHCSAPVAAARPAALAELERRLVEATTQAPTHQTP